MCILKVFRQYGIVDIYILCYLDFFGYYKIFKVIQVKGGMSLVMILEVFIYLYLIGLVQRVGSGIRLFSFQQLGRKIIDEVEIGVYERNIVRFRYGRIRDRDGWR